MNIVVGLKSIGVVSIEAGRFHILIIFIFLLYEHISTIFQLFNPFNKFDK
jgi:ABC-type iron transport system FetAB permease component